MNDYRIIHKIEILLQDIEHNIKNDEIPSIKGISKNDLKESVIQATLSRIKFPFMKLCVRKLKNSNGQCIDFDDVVISNLGGLDIDIQNGKIYIRLGTWAKSFLNFNYICLKRFVSELRSFQSFAERHP